MGDSETMGITDAVFQFQANRSEKTLKEVTSRSQSIGQDADALEAASQQFESLLLNFMIQQMRATIPESGLFPRSMAEDIFTSMLDEQYAISMSEQGGIGISRILLDQLADAQSEE